MTGSARACVEGLARRKYTQDPSEKFKIEKAAQRRQSDRLCRRAIAAPSLFVKKWARSTKSHDDSKPHGARVATASRALRFDDRPATGMDGDARARALTALARSSDDPVGSFSVVLRAAARNAARVPARRAVSQGPSREHLLPTSRVDAAWGARRRASRSGGITCLATTARRPASWCCPRTRSTASPTRWSACWSVSSPRRGGRVTAARRAARVPARVPPRAPPPAAGGRRGRPGTTEVLRAKREAEKAEHDRVVARVEDDKRSDEFASERKAFHRRTRRSWCFSARATGGPARSASTRLVRSRASWFPKSHARLRLGRRLVHLLNRARPFPTRRDASGGASPRRHRRLLILRRQKLETRATGRKTNCSLIRLGDMV